MKFTNKRLVSILLCLAMVLAMLPMAVFAEAPTTLYLKPNSNWTSAGARFAAVLATTGWSASTWVDMTDADGDGIYEVAVPNDGNAYSIVIFCRMNPDAAENNWDNKWNQTGDLSIPTDGNNLLTVNDGEWDCGTNCVWSVYTPSTGEDTTPSETETTEATEPVEVTYTYVIAGVEALCGAAWDYTATEGNTMTLGEDGIATITYSQLAASETAYQFKVVKVGSDGSAAWYGNGEANIEIVVGTTCDVTITFNTADNSIAVTGDGLGEKQPMVIETMCAVGAGSGNFLYGVNWDPASSVNAMSVENNLYSITYMNVAAGTYEYKFAANGAWDSSWGAGVEMANGVEYDAWYNGGNNTLTVATDGSTVTLYLDLSAMDFVTGEGAKCWVVIEEPAVSVAPETLVLGTNSFEIADGDNGVVSSTYTATKAGTLSVAPSYMNQYDAYSDTWTEVPAAYLANPFNMGQYFLVINGENVMLPAQVTVAAGDVVTIGVQSYYGVATKLDLDLTFVEKGAADIKWQVPTVANETDETIDLRLVSWVDTLDYSNVQFTMTLAGVTKTLDVTTVYQTIYGDAFAAYEPYNVFGDEANYFVTHTVTGIPAEYFGEEIEVTVTWYDLDGNVAKTSETRTIVISDNWA